MVARLYVASVVVTIITVWLAVKRMERSLAQAETTLEPNKKSIKGARGYLLLFVPVINLIIAGFFIGGYKKIYKRLVQERGEL